jgi:Carboxypeptidase regulatory-like domain
MTDSRGPVAFHILLFVTVLALSSGSVRAQLSAASLNGVVRDPQGAVVSKATVLLHNADTGFERTTSTNDSGAYVFPDINPGRYTLKVSASGFSTKEVSAFQLAVNQTATIDVSLTVGAASQVISVEATTEQLQASSAELGTVIATKEVNDLPLNGRNFTQLLSLTPGVVPISVGQNAMGGRTGGFAAPIAEGSDFSFPSINGATNRSNYFLTDGMNNFAAFLSTYAVPPIIDAIQEFKVVSHTDSSEFGSVLGGVVNVVTKSGTNRFRGTVWEYMRNSAFDSRPQFLPANQPKALFHQNQFGASFGGPIPLPALKHNTFFYFAYQGFRYSQPIGANILVPTATQLSGDFSELCTAGFNSSGICNNPAQQLYNPFTTTPSGSTFTRQPFAGNIIPSNLIVPGLVGFIQTVYPQAGQYNAATNSNAFNNDPNTQHQNEFNGRLDHTFSEKDLAWFRWSQIDSTTMTPNGELPGFLKNDSIPGLNWGANWVHVFSPTLQLQALFSRTKVSDNALTKLHRVNADSVISAAGFAPSFACNFSGTKGCLLPSLGLANGFANAGEILQNTPQATDNWQGSVTISKLRGTHTFSFGSNYITSVFSSPIAYDSVGFADTETGDPATGIGGFSLASYLLGVVNNANRRDVNEKTRKGGLFSAFFQDSWKASNKLTVNYGVRYDLTLIPPYGTKDTIGQQGGIETGDFDFSNGTYVLQFPPPPCTVRGAAPCIPSIMLDAQGNAVSCDPSTQTCLPPGTLPPHVVIDPRGHIAHNTYTNVGPHLGFAYRATPDTVVRGGAGIVYDNWAAVSQMSQNIEGDWPGIGQLIANNLNQPGGSTTNSQGLPTVSALNPFAGSGAAGLPAPTPFFSGGVNWHYDPHIKNAYAYQFNFGIQRQLNSTTTITGSYVGSLTHRANIGGMYNTALQPSPLPNPQSRSMYPYMISTFYDRSVGFADYHAFQLSVNKRYSNGLAYQVAYTYSKALDENDGWFGAEGKNVADPYNPRASLSPAGFDIPHLLTVNANYEIPVGRGKQLSSGNHAVDYIIGNWQVNGILTVRSGQRYSVTDNNGDPANTGNVGWAGYEQANLVGDPNSGSCPSGAHVHTQTCWINTSAFQSPAFGTFGNLRPDPFNAQRYWDLDFSIFRGFPIVGEGRKLEFRAEAFNLFNTVIFAAPGSDISNTGGFGKVTSTANSQRILQFGLRFMF